MVCKFISYQKISNFIYLKAMTPLKCQGFFAVLARLRRNLPSVGKFAG